MNILGISGSFRQASFNTSLLNAIQARLPTDWSMTITVPHGFPIYNEELRPDWPEAAQTLVQQVRDADAVIIATPEYNHSIPGGLKNALDWVSRFPEQPFKDKCVGIVGASSGRLGTVRAQAHLRQCLQCLDARVLTKPEVLVGFAPEVFSRERLDQGTDDVIRAFIESFGRFVALQLATANRYKQIEISS